MSTNYGPHTKYYPYIESVETFEVPLVTADDDSLYTRDWLQKLIADFRKYPEHVNCHLARGGRAEERPHFAVFRVGNVQVYQSQL